MAKKAVKKKTPAVEVYNVSVSQVDRSYKGILEWRNALKAAESITNPRRKLLYDLYKEIILDTHLEGVIGKRKLKITNKTFKFHDKNGKDNEEINTLIEKQFFEDVLNDLLDARFWGHSLLWFEELNDERQKYTLIERANVRPEVGEVIKEIYDDKGVPYRELPTSNYIIEAGKPKDLGLLLKCAPYAIYKKGNLSDWALFNQMFGFPFREFTYDGHDPKVKKEIERIAKSTLTAPYAVIPSNASMKILENGSKSSSNALFKDLSSFSDKQMSKAILHSTMTIDAEGGNYKGDVHHQSEKEVTKADEKYILRILNTQFIQILANFGYKVDGGRFIVDNEDGLSLKDRLAIDKDLNDIVEIEPEYFYDKYKIPVPSTGAKLKSQKIKESKVEEDTSTSSASKGKDKSQKSKRKDLKDKRSFKLRLNDLIDRFFSW